ncbi:hypothetical protein BGZ76_000208 [Entomortierella beljakovae]|nr:hypothetical protein BGZ76_000208 [Entomortierella beljakovae]
MNSSPISSSQVAPSAPRAQKSNSRKSAITSGLQKQSQYQSQPRNNNSNAPRYNQNHAHSRHQSMPPHQRSNNKADMNNVTILKRSSAAPASNAATQVKVTNEGSHQIQGQQYYQQQQQQQRNHYQNQKPKPQFQQQQPRARRVQMRREIETQAQTDLDLALQSPPLDPTSPPSSSDSDDSESTLSHASGTSLNARRQRQLATSPPMRPSSAPIQSQYRYQNMDVQRPSINATTATSPEKKSTLYAGPTFHNAPPPASLPIPAFARSTASSPAEPIVEKLPSMPFFGEAASPQLNSMRAQVTYATPNWSSHQSMPMGHHYNVPERMATSSFIPHAPGQYGSDELMEISQSLRTLLKIQSQ